MGSGDCANAVKRPTANSPIEIEIVRIIFISWEPVSGFPYHVY
jgi:hypothetical protein